MKKLMFAAAVMAVGAAMAVESQIVGYQEIGQTSGNQLIQGCQFQKVGGTSVSLQDIVFKAGGEVAESGCDIWWWDNNKPGGGAGFVTKCEWSALYYDPDDPEAEDGFVFKPAWINWVDDMPVRVMKVFGPGEGFFAQPSRSNPTLSINGEVFGCDNTSDPVRSIDYLTSGDQLLVCNPFPTDVNLQDIVFTSAGEIAESGCDIWWWDNDRPGSAGFVTKCEWSALYYDPDDPEAEDGFVFKPAWVNWVDDMPVRVMKTFVPGEGFFAQPSRSAPKLTFPNAFYAK